MADAYFNNFDTIVVEDATATFFGRRSGRRAVLHEDVLRLRACLDGSGACALGAVAMKTVLTIAGSDSSGGAGIQADIKTIEAHGLFATSAITALTAQNTLGVSGVLDVDPAFVVAQIDAVFEDIRPDAVKIGMVSSPEIVRAIACALKRCEARHVVVDPVMVATSGSALIDDDAVSSLSSTCSLWRRSSLPTFPKLGSCQAAKSHRNRTSSPPRVFIAGPSPTRLALPFS